MTNYGAGSGNVKVNFDNLRNTAAAVDGLEPYFDQVENALKKLEATTRQEAARNTTDNGPSPYFSPLLEGLRVALGRVQGNVSNFRSALQADAQMLREHADATQNTDAEDALRAAHQSGTK